eukprot:1729442-Pleurochrysis_carterae.AAC.3
MKPEIGMRFTRDMESAQGEAAEPSRPMIAFPTVLIAHRRLLSNHLRAPYNSVEAQLSPNIQTDNNHAQNGSCPCSDVSRLPAHTNLRLPPVPPRMRSPGPPRGQPGSPVQSRRWRARRGAGRKRRRSAGPRSRRRRPRAPPAGARTRAGAQVRSSGDETGRWGEKEGGKEGQEKGEGVRAKKQEEKGKREKRDSETQDEKEKQRLKERAVEKKEMSEGESE